MPEMSEILEDAVKLEAEGIEYYETAAEKAENPLAQHTFTHLAEQEREHEKLLRAYCDVVEESGTCPTPQEMAAREYKLLEEGKEIFQKARQQMEKSTWVEEELVELYEDAMELERRFINMYQEQVGALEIEEQKELFEYLVTEEKKHLKLLQNGQKFLENPEAEWWVEQEQWIVTG